MIFIPLLGVFFQTTMAKGKTSHGLTEKWVALSASLLSSMFGLWAVFFMQKQTADIQLLESINWVGSYAIHYEVGMDGLSAVLVLLISILFPVLIAAEWTQKVASRGIYSLFLILQSAFIGTVCAQDLFLMFFFWSLSAVPFYFLIGIWGGEKREESAIQTLVTASLGNALLFASFLLIYYTVEPHTFLLKDLSGGKLVGKYFLFMGNGLYTPNIAFLLFCLGLAFRLPIWPMHGWFTHLALEAPSSVFAAVCGVSVPVALYLFMRVSYSIFPDILPYLGSWVVMVGVFNLIFGVFCAFAQSNLSLLLAFSCMAEVGFLLVGVGSLSPAGVVGAAYQQISLGLVAAGFGLFCGVMFNRLGHVSFLKGESEKGLGGLATQAPWVSLFCGVLIASLLGIPGFGGFVSHALLTIGSYSVHPMAVLLSGGLFIMVTYYLFSMYRNIFLGQAGKGAAVFSDLSLRERVYIMPVVFILLFLGVYPKPFLDLIRPTVLTLLSTLH